MMNPCALGGASFYDRHLLIECVRVVVRVAVLVALVTVVHCPVGTGLSLVVVVCWVVCGWVPTVWGLRRSPPVCTGDPVVVLDGGWMPWRLF